MTKIVPIADSALLSVKLIKNARLDVIGEVHNSRPTVDASLSSDVSSRLTVGVFSDGLSTNAFPQAMAIGNIHIGTIPGKLNGVMPTQTASGRRIEKLSIPLPIS
jgi:hypothetical protein